MKTFSATDAAISGFVLVREHLKTVAVWVLIATVASAALSLTCLSLFGPQMQILADAQLSGRADSEEAQAAMVQMGPFFVFSCVYLLAYYGVVQAAVYRVLLRPTEGRFAFLRFGRDELRLIGVNLSLGLLFLSGFLAAVVVVGMVVGIFAALFQPLAFLIAILAIAALACALIYFGVRLSLAPAQTFVSRRISLFGGFALTKGRFWPLFGAYFVAGVLALTVYALLLVVTLALGAALSGGDLDSLVKLVKPDFSSLQAFLSPTGILRIALSGLLNILMAVTVYAPAAMIHRQIAEPESMMDPNATGPFVV